MADKTTVGSRKWRARNNVGRVTTRAHLGRYEDVSAAADQAGDSGFCAVAAMATVFGASYATINGILLELGARRMRGGTFTSSNIEKVAERFGKRAVIAYAKAGTRTGAYLEHAKGAKLSAEGFTLRTVAARYPRGRFVVLVAGHAVGLRNGRIHDWTAATAMARRVEAIWQILPREVEGAYSTGTG